MEPRSVEDRGRPKRYYKRDSRKSTGPYRELATQSKSEFLTYIAAFRTSQ
jgi:hypothetical protein